MAAAYNFGSLLDLLGWLALIFSGTLAGTWIGVKFVASPKRVNQEVKRSEKNIAQTHVAQAQKARPSASDFERLVSFLQLVFSPDEIRTLVHRTGGDDAVSQLSGGCANQQTECAVAVLVRMREIDGEFFDYIIEKRPKWREEVESLRLEWVVRD